MSRRPVFPGDSEIAALVQEVQRMLGPRLSALTPERGADAEQILRWQLLGPRFRREREARGWTLKAAAAQLHCPQYRLRAIETSGMGCDAELLARYADALGLRAFLNAWARANPALAAARGIELAGRPSAAKAPRKRAQRSASRGTLRAVPDSVYRFRIALRELEPAVWRCIEVPASYSFWDLHVAIQDVMGWQDCHLHSFRVRDPQSGERAEIGIPDEDPVAGARQTRASWREPLGAWLRSPGERAEYLYDYGDDWRHDIELEAIEPPESHTAYPRCAGGARACPPEDCGGAPGYQDLLAALADPAHPQHASILEWLGGAHDPTAFDPAAVRFDDPQARFKRAFGPRKRER